ncbi:MAG: hypothetical protein AAF664_20005 [Planctomycetota bacterium]
MVRLPGIAYHIQKRLRRQRTAFVGATAVLAELVVGLSTTPAMSAWVLIERHRTRKFEAAAIAATEHATQMLALSGTTTIESDGLNQLVEPGLRKRRSWRGSRGDR